MKICPTCRKTYTDDGLNFCLEDGSVLTVTSDVPPETVMMNQPRYTDPNPAGGQGIRTSYGDQAAFTMQPKKSSKAWIWVLGILAVLILACGGGFVGLFVYLASIAPDDGNRTPTPSPTRPGLTPTPTPFPRNQVQSVDLKNWVRKDSSFGNTDFADGEFFMSSKKPGFYYVVAATAEFKTELASSSVILRNVGDATSSLGYGIVFHSDPKPLQKGYAFLIDTKNQKYRVVRHEPGKETDVVDWTTASSIRSGTAENTLEVRDTSSRVELYINGEMVTTIKNTHGYKGGVVGLYSGDAVNIGFKKLEIVK
jgi:hypothetical protein